MESDIVTEGFVSCGERGARIHKLIADGDSNTYKNLRDERVYKDPDVFIEKFECVNHLHRNFRAKFAFMSCGIRTASKHWRNSELSNPDKIKNLEEDVMNAPAHYFGVHDSCKTYFCTKTTDQGARDVL